MLAPGRLPCPSQGCAGSVMSQWYGLEPKALIFLQEGLCRGETTLGPGAREGWEGAQEGCSCAHPCPVTAVGGGGQSPFFRG